jgi:tetratricopeptide (TPR) repeat protein
MHARKRFLKPLAWLSALFASLAAFAQQAPLKDSTFDELLQKDKIAEVERLSHARLTTNPRDETAYRYIAITAFLRNDSVARSKAFEAMERCIAALPSSSMCHLMAGRLLGTNAAELGMLKAMGSLGRIKELLIAAHDLDPKSYDARLYLMQFYLQAPGIMGGSTKKARELADGAKSFNSDDSRLLQARIAAHEKNPEKAEKLLEPLYSSTTPETNDRIAATWVSIGVAYLQEKSIDKAKSVLLRTTNNAPDNAAAHFYLGRTQLEKSAWDAALASLAEAAKHDKTRALATDYYLGLAHHGKGDLSRARNAYQRALAWPKLSDDMRKDVNRRLQEIGTS